MYVCMHVCMYYVNMYACMYTLKIGGCMYVRIYACINESMYVCVSVYVHVLEGRGDNAHSRTEARRHWRDSSILERLGQVRSGYG